MSTAFTRTMQALEAGGFRRNAAALLVGGGFLAGWAGWFWFSRLPRYEVTDTARIEADQASHLIQARVGGQVVASIFAFIRVHSRLILPRGVHSRLAL